MKKILLLMLCLTFQGIFAQDADVRKSIDLFFEGFHARDSVKLKSVCKDEMVLHSVIIRKNGNEFKVEKASEFIKSVVSFPNALKFEEKILSYQIQSDGTIAHVWTPYEFYIGGKLSHSGVNSFQLINEKGLWKITYCIDTRKRS